MHSDTHSIWQSASLGHPRWMWGARQAVPNLQSGRQIPPAAAGSRNGEMATWSSRFSNRFAAVPRRTCSDRAVGGVRDALLGVWRKCVRGGAAGRGAGRAAASARGGPRGNQSRRVVHAAVSAKWPGAPVRTSAHPVLRQKGPADFQHLRAIPAGRAVCWRWLDELRGS
jgi:hypothetical protein